MFYDNTSLSKTVSNSKIQSIKNPNLMLDKEMKKDKIVKAILPQITAQLKATLLGAANNETFNKKAEI